MKRAMIYATLFSIGCYSGAQGSCFSATGPTPPPVVQISPTPSITPVPVTTPTPGPDPCLVVGVNVSGTTTVKAGELLRLDITPVGPLGPIEGKYDYCNKTRFVTPENVVNLTCNGSCSGFVQSWKAVAPGAFSIRMRVEQSVSSTFVGEVTK